MKVLIDSETTTGIVATRGMAPELERFCRAMYPRILGSLILYLGDRGVAEELAQETLARVCVHWRRIRKADSPEAWAHRVALNLCNSYFRRRSAERRATRRAQLKMSRPPPEPDLASTIAIRQAIGKLPRRERRAIVLHYYAGLSYQELALALQIPVGTGKTLVHRALATLRSQVLDYRKEQ